MSMERPDATGLRMAGKALEDSFFARENAALLKKLKEKAAVEAKKQAFREIANVKNEAVIDALVELDLDASDLAALNLVPLIEVAWADGAIQSKEREAILKAAAQGGIKPGTDNYTLLENWLATKPGPELMACWKGYAHTLFESLDSVVGNELKERLMTRTTAIAKAAGGFLGIGAISDAEQRILDELDAAF